ncbi:hypothetical protein KY495_19160 [Massilia sp. PAMC28688]|uniref:hypothetical protein n=1 Tax=Massilia sp. PAMC28688 TaxID=2861283 RepID=UPI001C636C05|nr:hypothetical protein [Massilia sp. PAMC28688]QYF92817.1 hypothetical protein KY495_19160 [Massilia sp. PAMC28688]
METPKSKWDVERAAAWLRRHTWGGAGEERPEDMDDDLLAAAEAESETIEVGDDDIDIACWPALVAPFYD